MRIISRAGWGATSRVNARMRLPVATLWLHHSVTRATANPTADMRTIERIGVQRFGYVSYSYVIHPDGSIFEGAGDTIGAHTGGQNSTSLAVCLIGNFENDTVIPAAQESIVWLARHLRDTGRLTRTSGLRGHRDAPNASTACPGRNAYALLPSLGTRIAAPTAPPPPPRSWLDMASKDDVKNALREVLDEGTYLAAHDGKQWVIHQRAGKAVHIKTGADFDRLRQAFPHKGTLGSLAGMEVIS